MFKFKFREPILIDSETAETEINEVCDELIYRNYRYNRILFPEITVESWTLTYTDIIKMEARFQQEIKK